MKKFEVIWAESTTVWFKKEVIAENADEAYNKALMTAEPEDETNSNLDHTEKLEVTEIKDLFSEVE